MNILVTGGSGFIGSALVRRLIDGTTHSVTNVDCLTYAGNPDSLRTVEEHERYSFECVDICDTPQIREVLDRHRPSRIIHLAAESHVDRSIDGPSIFVRTNVVGTQSLLEASLDYWRELAATEREDFRFHHVSTDEVYGDLGPDGGYFTEDTAYNPSSPYSATKAASDHLVRAWQRTYGLPTLVTNCSNNYGPFQFPEKLIPHIILSALAGKRLPVYGDGSQVRDWIHVDDHADALIAIAESGVLGRTYILGGRAERQNIDVVRTVCRILDDVAPDRRAPHSESFEDLIEFVADRPGHDVRYAVDPSRAEQELGYTPARSFEDALRSTVTWYLENEWWWSRVFSGAYRLERIGSAGGAA